MVEDDDPEFDPLQVPAPDTAGPLEARPTGGVGIHLLRQMTRDVAYERACGRNRLRIRV